MTYSHRNQWATEQSRNTMMRMTIKNVPEIESSSSSSSSSSPRHLLPSCSLSGNLMTHPFCLFPAKLFNIDGMSICPTHLQLKMKPWALGIPYTTYDTPDHWCLGMVMHCGSRLSRLHHFPIYHFLGVPHVHPSPPPLISKNHATSPRKIAAVQGTSMAFITASLPVSASWTRMARPERPPAKHGFWWEKIHGIFRFSAEKSGCFFLGRIPQ